MGRNLMRRVRWGNVALLAAACAALAFGSAWAFSTTTSPTLPGDEARPLVRERPTADVGEAGLGAPTARQDQDEDARPRERARGPHPPRMRARPRPRPPAAPRNRRWERPVPDATAPAASTPGHPPPVAPAPRVIVPAPRQAAPPRAGGGGGEFGFEGG